MVDQPSHVDVDFYAVFEPQWHRYNKDNLGRPILESAKLVKTTTKIPSVMVNSAVVRMRVRLDADTLLPVVLDSIINVQPSQATTIKVTAMDPGNMPGQVGQP